MKKVYFATRARGFFKHLFSCDEVEYEFIGANKKIYELNSRKRKLLTKIARLKVFDWLGLIQVIKCKNKNANIYGSYNRFLKSDKPYFIYVENPTALYHYRINRNKSWLGRRKVNHYLNDNYLKAIICMSQACFNTFDRVCGRLDEDKIIKQVIYPLVPKNDLVNEQKIINRCKKEEINLLFIAQGIRFLSKGALEVIEAYRRLRSEYQNIKLTMVTSIGEVNNEIIKMIEEKNDIKLLDFNLTYEEMKELYANSTILLQPTSDESFGMTILEGMKSGLPILATRLYAIPEMVTDGVNGYLTDPQWWYFDKNNIPNPNIWGSANRKKTIDSGRRSEKITQFLYEKIKFLNENREILEKMSLASWEKANSAPFSESHIIKSWNSLLNEIDETNTKSCEGIR